MVSQYKFKLITLQKLEFDDLVESISTRTVVGEIGIYAKHIPLVGIIPENSTLSVTGDNNFKYVLKDKGVLLVQKNSEVVVMAPYVESI
jgi:F0F1-type ATP synthase epsilon subunit